MVKVSVIMGVYNGEKNLDVAISSICNQTFSDWELIICDDGSYDSSYKKMLQWELKDSRIKVIKNLENLKLAATLNKCIDIAQGKYIARMDDDDISYPERLSKQFLFLESHLTFDWVSSLVDCYDGAKYLKNKFYRKAEPQKEDFLRGTQFVHPATMFRRECLELVGGYRVDKETRRTEDYDLFMHLYSLGCKGYNIQEPLLRYYINPKMMKYKRKYCYRLDEAKVRYRGFRELGLMPRGLIFVMRPLLAGLIPKWVLQKLLYYKSD